MIQRMQQKDGASHLISAMPFLLVYDGPEMSIYPPKVFFATFNGFLNPAVPTVSDYFKIS